MTSTTKNQATLDARPGRLDMIVTREFDAPRELVFRAFTEPELFAQWMGPRRLEIELDKFEPRSGGSWRYINTDTDGSSYAFHGVFHEVLAPRTDHPDLRIRRPARSRPRHPGNRLLRGTSWRPHRLPRH